jgi:hypothetical protein
MPIVRDQRVKWVWETLTRQRVNHLYRVDNPRRGSKAVCGLVSRGPVVNILGAETCFRCVIGAIRPAFKKASK